MGSSASCLLTRCPMPLLCDHIGGPAGAGGNCVRHHCSITNIRPRHYHHAVTAPFSPASERRLSGGGVFCMILHPRCTIYVRALAGPIEYHIDFAHRVERYRRRTALTFSPSSNHRACSGPAVACAHGHHRVHAVARVATRCADIRRPS